MDKIEQIYLDLILEAQYDNYKWQRYGKYQGFEIYYSIKHVKDRINERYDVSFGTFRNIVNNFIKTILKEKTLEIRKINELSFTVHAIKTNVWFSGRFKRNNGVWRVYMSTLLPHKDKDGNEITPKYSSNDYRKDINA